MKPDWKDAPSWARYLAMDYDGTWYFYENIPEDGSIAWLITCGKDRCAGISNWRDTLEERPVHKSSFDYEAEGK